MNELHGHIKTIEVTGNLSLVTVALAANCVLKAIVIDTPETASYLKKDQAIAVLFKETEVIVGLGNQSQISIENKLPATILAVKNGKLLSEIKLKTRAGNVTSILSSEAVTLLQLEENREVVAMIKLNEIMLRSL